MEEIITTNEIVAVETIKELANLDKEEHSSVKLIEDSLAGFLGKTFQMAIDEDDYQKQIKDAIIAKLPDMKPSELIALATSASTNKNDLISKLVTPTMQLLTAAQQNELSLRQQEKQPVLSQTNIREINHAAPGEILQGLQALFHVATTLKQKDDFIETVS